MAYKFEFNIIGYRDQAGSKDGKDGMEYYGPMNGKPGSQAWQWWARLSTTYAQGIPEGGTVNVFLNNPFETGIWNLVEKPILESKGVNIIVH